MGDITQDNSWYMQVTYEEAKKIIGVNIRQMSRSFVAIGYYLKHIRDNEMYLEDGYKSIWEFAEDLYGISRSTATRWMAMNDRFSKDGNSPVLAEQYKNFGKSQLQEMLYLTDEQAAEVTEDMTVKEIREIRKPTEKEEDQKKCIAGKSKSGFCGAAAYCGEPVNCCAVCKNDCNGRCGWLDEPLNPSDVIVKEIQEEQKMDNLPEDSGADERAESVESGSEVEPHVLSSIEPMGKCAHSEGYKCTILSEEAKQTAGDGTDCHKKCCWECTKKEGCRLICDAARHKPEECATSHGVAQVKESDVVDVEYKEVIPGSEPRFTSLFLRDILWDKERELAQMEECNAQPDGNLPLRMMQEHRAVVAGLRLLLEYTEMRENIEEGEDET